jgi:hypothetical protein
MQVEQVLKLVVPYRGQVEEVEELLELVARSSKWIQLVEQEEQV